MRSHLAAASVALLIFSAALAARPGQPPAEPPRAGAKTHPILTGRMSDEKGRPLPGVKVQLYGGFATRLHGPSAITGSDGVYRFDPLEAGSMTMDEAAGRWDLYIGIQVEHPTHASADGCSWWDITVPGIAGYEYRRDFTMHPGGTLKGVVLDAAGEPAAGVGLRIHRADAAAPHFLRYATTDDQGRFEEGAIAPGRFKIDVNDHPYPVIGEVRIEEGKTAEVELESK